MGTQVAGGVHICLLGGFRVEVGSHAIDDAAWRLRKAKALIKLLALAPDHHLHRDQFLNVLWPDLPPKAALNNFHQTLHIARHTFDLALGSGDAESVLPLRDQVLILNPPAHLWVDVEAFEAAGAAALRTSDVSAHEQAIGLYAGDLLPEDLYEEWTSDRREAAYEHYLELLLHLARLHEAADEWVPATEALKQVLAREPAHEEAHVGLMRLHALQGRRQAAVQQYERLKEALRTHLDANPDPASTHLLQEILDDRFLPPERKMAASAMPPTSVARSGPRRPPVRHVRPRSRPGNLAAPLTAFVGRTGELATLKDLLAGCRLLTLTGPGGCGKTRLALELAAAVAERFSDGTWWVDLQALQDGNLTVYVIASTLGIREQPGRSIETSLAEHLVDMRTLLVLDNCEHLLAGCADLAKTLLQAGPGVQIMATSRERLGVSGETLWPVPPLSLPLVHPELTVEEALASEAVRLFVSRSRSMNPAFRLSGANVRAVAEICRSLDGLPLSIELAAARTAHLSADQILDRLGDRFHLLTIPGQAPVRYRTLGEAIDWSYRLLSANEQALFNRLSVFAGTFSLEAVHAVCIGKDLNAENVLGILSGLIDKSMVLLEETPKGDVRYRLLETMREYAHERLIRAGEESDVRRQHRDWILQLVEAAEPALRGKDQAVWFARLDLEGGNIRAALEWSKTDTVAPDAGLRIAGGLWQYWHARAYFSEGRAWLDALILRSTGASSLVRAKALNAAGLLAYRQGDYDRTFTLCEKARAVAEHQGDQWQVALALHYLAHCAQQKGDFEQAEALMERSISLYRELGDRWGIALSTGCLGTIAKRGAQYERAAPLYESSVTLFREVGDRWGVAAMLANLAAATKHLGDARLAAARWRESLVLSRDLSLHEIMASCLDGLANLFAASGTVEQVARLLGAADALFANISAGGTPIERSEFYGAVATLRARMGDEAFSVAWAEGRRMRLEEAVEYALALAENPIADSCANEHTH